MASSSQWNSETQNRRNEAESFQHFGSFAGPGGEAPLDAQQLLAQEFYPAPRRNLRPLLLFLLAAVILALLYLGVTTLSAPKGPPPFQALGAGVSNVDGLRGHLATRWVKRAEYQLSFQALNPYEDSAFSYVVAHPPRPIAFHIRLLDATGFALCSKEIVFPADPSRIQVTPVPFPELIPKSLGMVQPGQPAPLTSPAALEQLAKGRDVFQEQTGDNGQITALTAQGILPCTPGQYRQFSYWDFSTDFPSLAEQQAIALAPILAAERKAAAEREALRRKLEREHPSAFYLSGDADVNYYDSTSGVVEVASGQRFRLLNKSNATLAHTWANDDVQVHYKCDQFANCQLTDGSSKGVIEAKSIP